MQTSPGNLRMLITIRNFLYTSFRWYGKVSPFVRQSVAVLIKYGIAFVVHSALFTFELARNIWQGMCAVSVYVNVKQTISSLPTLHHGCCLQLRIYLKNGCDIVLRHDNNAQ